MKCHETLKQGFISPTCAYRRGKQTSLHLIQILLCTSLNLEVGLMVHFDCMAFLAVIMSLSCGVMLFGGFKWFVVAVKVTKQHSLEKQKDLII